MFVLHNPHSFDMIFKPLSYVFARKRAHLKYKHYMDLFFSNREIFITVDYSESSLLSSRAFLLLPFFIRFLIVNAELMLWVKINKGYKIKRLGGPGLSNSILLNFTYKGAVHLTKQKKRVFDSCKGICFHLSHYMIRTQEKSELINKYKYKSVLLADVDIRNNSYFRMYFGNDYPLFVVPFQVSQRFENKNNSSLRSNKVLISGTVHDLSIEEPKEYYSDFISFFDSNAYHKIRAFYYVNSHKNIDSKVSPFRQGKSALQKNYFRIDLVELLNQYKFVCYDMELSGAPAITTFEAIACGCIPIVQKGSLNGLGLEGKFNFIEFGESIEEFNQFLSDEFEDICTLFDYQENDSIKFDISEHLYDICVNSKNEIINHFNNKL